MNSIISTWLRGHSRKTNVLTLPPTGTLCHVIAPKQPAESYSRVSLPLDERRPFFSSSLLLFLWTLCLAAVYHEHLSDWRPGRGNYRSHSVAFLVRDPCGPTGNRSTRGCPCYLRFKPVISAMTPHFVVLGDRLQHVHVQIREASSAGTRSLREGSREARVSAPRGTRSASPSLAEKGGAAIKIQ